MSESKGTWPFDVTSTTPRGAIVMGHEAVGYITTGPTWTTADAPTIEGLTRIIDAFREVDRENNRMLVQGLKALIVNLDDFLAWSRILGVSYFELCEVMCGARQPSGLFWDQIRRVFEPMRKAVKP